MRHAAITALAGLALAATVAGGVAPAQTTAGSAVTTGQLGELCASPEATPQAYCRGFLIGVGQYHASVTAAPGGVSRPVFCIPAEPSPTVEQAQASFAAWARANPQHAGERAADGLARWAVATFPCPAPARARR